MRRYRYSQSGFTFLEVMVALIIMASAAAVLIGMQGSAAARTLRDSDAQQAMLLARRIMSSIETIGDETTLQPFDNEPALNALNRWNIPEPSDEKEKSILAPFFVSLLVEDWVLPLPNIDPDPVKKITLRVTWGQGVDETFLVTYLLEGSKEPE